MPEYSDLMSSIGFVFEKESSIKLAIANEIVKNVFIMIEGFLLALTIIQIGKFRIS